MPKPLEIAAEYAHLKCVEPKPVMIAMAKLIQICGDKDIQDYDRKDARAFVDQYGKVKTTTIRRRLNSINAVFNWAAYELDLEQRNPDHTRYFRHAPARLRVDAKVCGFARGYAAVCLLRPLWFA